MRNVSVGVLILSCALVGCLETRTGRVIVAPTATVESNVTPDVDVAVVAAPCEDEAFGLWPFPGGGRPERIALAPDGDAFVVAQTELVRLAANGGCVVWQRTLPVVARDVAAFGDDVVVARVDGVERFVGASGASLWSSPHPDGAVAIAAGASSVASITGGGELVLMDGDGGVLWRARFFEDIADAALGDVAMLPDGDVVVVGNVSGCAVVWRARAEDGRVVWRRVLVGGARALPRVAAESSGDLFVSALWRGERDRQGVNRLGGGDGHTLWSYDAPAMGGDAPALAGAGSDLIVGGVVTEGTEMAPDYFIEPTEGFGLEGYVARFAAHMAVMWTLEPYGGDEGQYVTDVAGESSGTHWVIGWYEHEVRTSNFDTGFLRELELESPTGGGFVARRPVGIGW